MLQYDWLLLFSDVIRRIRFLILKCYEAKIKIQNLRQLFCPECFTIERPGRSLSWRRNAAFGTTDVSVSLSSPSSSSRWGGMHDCAKRTAAAADHSSPEPEKLTRPGNPIWPAPDWLSHHTLTQPHPGQSGMWPKNRFQNGSFLIGLPP